MKLIQSEEDVKRIEPVHANISIPARSKTHHFVAEQSRDLYYPSTEIFRIEDYTDSKGLARTRLVNIGSYSTPTREFSGPVAKGSPNTVLGRLRQRLFEWLEELGVLGKEI